MCNFSTRSKLFAPEEINDLVTRTVREPASIGRPCHYVDTPTVGCIDDRIRRQAGPLEHVAHRLSLGSTRARRGVKTQLSTPALRKPSAMRSTSSLRLNG
jgi:hypothetical protein